MTSVSSHQRIFGLDLLRTINVLSVVVTYTITLVGKTKWYFSVASYAAVVRVEIFFVTSGF